MKARAFSKCSVMLLWLLVDVPSLGLNLCSSEWMKLKSPQRKVAPELVVAISLILLMMFLFVRHEDQRVEVQGEKKTIVVPSSSLRVMAMHLPL